MRSAELRSAGKNLLAYAVLTAIASSLATGVKAQTFSEWFRQKSTQKKYMAQQLEALRVFASYCRSANEIGRTGLDHISGALDSEHGLHLSNYYSLQLVSRTVKNDERITEMMQWQKEILFTISDLDKDPSFKDSEQEYLSDVKNALLKDCNLQIRELQTLLSDGGQKMSDAERLERIGVIHAAMEENYRFAATFVRQIKTYYFQRIRERNNVRSERKFTGIEK